MKFRSIALLAAVPCLLAQQYEIPEYEYNNEDPNCDNVESLISATTQDLTNFKNFVSITLPNRSSKLNDAYASALKTCAVVKTDRPYLVQTNKLQNENIVTLQKIMQEVKTIEKSLTFGKKKSEGKKKTESLNFIQLSTNNITPGHLCTDVQRSIIDLKNYLRWLIPTVQKYYIDGLLSHRLEALNNLLDQCGCTPGPRPGPEETEETIIPPGPEETEETIIPPGPEETEETIIPPGPEETEETIIPPGPEETEETIIPPGPEETEETIIPPGPEETEETEETIIPPGPEETEETIIPPGPEETEETIIPPGPEETEETEVTPGPVYDPLQCEDANYNGYKNIGSEQNDITQFPGYTIAQLKEWCNAHDECVAFSSLGYVKRAIKPLSQWADRSMYPNYQFCVKKTTPIPAEPVYNVLQCEDENYVGYTTKGSEGSDIATYSGKTIAQLKDLCNANPRCVAFSSSGYLKGALKPYSQWADRSSIKNYQFCVKRTTTVSQ